MKLFEVKGPGVDKLEQQLADYEAVLTKYSIRSYDGMHDHLFQLDAKNVLAKWKEDEK